MLIRIDVSGMVGEIGCLDIRRSLSLTFLSFTHRESEIGFRVMYSIVSEKDTVVGNRLLCCKSDDELLAHLCCMSPFSSRAIS